MAPAAIAFWRETSIAVILLLLRTASICTCRDNVLDYQADAGVDRPTMPEIMSHIIENNTIEEKKPTSEKTPHKSNKDFSGKEESSDNTKQFPPRWKDPLIMNKTLKRRPLGTTTKFKCDVEGNPTPKVKWQKDGGPVDRNYSGTYLEYHDTLWSMTLVKLEEADNGNYTCIACNEMGCINHTVTLEVQEREPTLPYIEEGYPGNLTVLVNATVRLSCPSISILKPTMVWKRSANQTLLDDEGKPTNKTILVEKNIESENPSDKPEQLTLYNVTKEKEGWYVCVVRDAMGSSTAKGYLRVLVSLLGNDHAALPRKSYSLFYSLIYLLGATFIVAAILVVMILKKLKKEKIKKQLAREIARAAIVIYCTKKVTVEKPQLNGAPTDHTDGLLMPVVKIEKKKISQVQGNTTEPMMMSEYELPMDVDWEVARDALALGKVLGEGEFGKVVKAECLGMLKPGMKSVVAVKMLKEGHTDAEMTALVTEMEIMKMIGKHVNIINLLGCCTQGGPLYVITDYAPNGNLREFLRNHRPGNTNDSDNMESLKEKKTLTQKDLISFAYQVAQGMEYLASNRCIHRDLAARNVLVSDKCVLKIADFGMAKDVHSNNYYRKKTAGLLPVRWMAPESLHHRVFTTQTDVWSFGVLLWEIMTLGGTPYPTVPGQYLLQYLRAGHRMEKPPCCSLQIYKLMRECWSCCPRDRPSFAELVEHLDKILSVTADQEYLDLGLPQLDTPPSSCDGSADESDSEAPSSEEIRKQSLPKLE